MRRVGKWFVTVKRAQHLGALYWGRKTKHNLWRYKMKQNKNLNAVEEALKHYTEDFVVEKKSNPMLVRINGKPISIYVANIIPTPNPQKMRIATSKSPLDAQRKIRKANKYDVAVIGVFSSQQTFVAWDPERILALRELKSSTVFIPKKFESNTTKGNPCVYKTRSINLQRSTYTLSMHPTALGPYLENIGMFHSLDSEAEVYSELKHAATVRLGDSTKCSIDVDSNDNELRRKFMYTRSAYPRDPRFRAAVLEAYGHACCICGRQLDILEAAHIIPHSDEFSSDSIENGLAMCPEHHMLYDSGLLLPGPDYKLVFNKVLASQLCKNGRGGGIDEVKKLRGKKFAAPNDNNMRPSKKNLTKGIEIRLGKKWKDLLR